MSRDRSYCVVIDQGVNLEKKGFTALNSSQIPLTQSKDPVM